MNKAFQKNLKKLEKFLKQEKKGDIKQGNTKAKKYRAKS